MRFFKNVKSYFSKYDILLFTISVIILIVSFCIFDRVNFLTLIMSILSVVMLILIAKGNVIGQFLSIVFCTFYSIISFNNRYYGEMITYLFMTMPMAILSIFSWLKNPYKDKKLQVKVNKLTFKEVLFMFLLTAIVTFIFYFILKYFDTANLFFSTISISTSFIAVYLTFRRSEYYALGYASNDIVLIILWILASVNDIQYVSLVTCFVVFLINDIYGYISWTKMKKSQID
ncbi:MAG: nicotinamide mononucleotide transporter [Clostridia bacterium]|nr:nicotinamide mononucleotide transporter [Clostridia bacterium]